MDHYDWNTTGVEGLEHEQAAEFFGLLGIEQAQRSLIGLAELRAIQKVR
jgi:hypothetical protein